MPMTSQIMESGVWYDLTGLDDPNMAIYQLYGSGVATGVISTIEPPSNSPGFYLSGSTGPYVGAMSIPDSKYLWIKMVTGNIELIYGTEDPAGGECTFLWNSGWSIYEDGCTGGYTATEPDTSGIYDGEVRSGTCII